MKNLLTTMILFAVPTTGLFAADASPAPFEAAAGHDGIWEVSADDGSKVKKTTDKSEAKFYQWAATDRKSVV